MFRIIFVNTVVILLLFSCQQESNIKPANKAVGAVWIAEPNMEYIDFALEQNIKLCPIFHITNVRTPEIDTWIHFIKEAQKKGVKLRMSPIPDGYDDYVNTINVIPQLSIVSNFLDLIQSERIKPFEIILDAEGRNRDRINSDFTRFLQTGSIDTLNLFFDKVPTKAEQEAALALFQNFVDEAHNDGWKVGITTLDLVAFDNQDNDNDLERFMAIPLRGVNWDFITYQVYRSGTAMTSFYVYEVAKLARNEFGDKGGVDIGIMGVNQLYGGGDYRSFSEWENDVAATRAAKVNPDLVVGFRLELVNTSADNMVRWFKETDATPVPAAPKPDLFSEVNFKFIKFQDRVFDEVLH